jgi:hypothetical protein
MSAPPPAGSADPFDQSKKLQTIEPFDCAPFDSAQGRQDMPRGREVRQGYSFFL